MDLKLNADRFTGDEYVNLYHKYRPTPITEMLHQALNYLDRPKAKRVLDVGCGTGISTKVWENLADEIIGLEPSKDMIEIAKRTYHNNHIKFLVGFSNDIPLSSNSVDIVSCSQSFHWMEPKSTLKEINRVLKKNGILMIYDVIWPPSVNYEFEKSYNDLFEKIRKLTKKLKEVIAYTWDKKRHLENVHESNYFKFLKETYFHKTEKLNTDQFIGIALSQGGLEALLKRGFSKDEIGISEFIDKINDLKSAAYNEITYNYRVIYGIK